MKEAKRVRGKAMNNPERNVDEQNRDDMEDKFVRQEEPPMEQLHNLPVSTGDQSKADAPRKLIRDIRTLVRKNLSPEPTKASKPLPTSPHGHLKRMLHQNPNIQPIQTTSKPFPYMGEACGKGACAKNAETYNTTINRESAPPTDTINNGKGATDSEDDVILTQLLPGTNKVSIIQEILDTNRTQALDEQSCNESVNTPSGATPLKLADTPNEVRKLETLSPTKEIPREIPPVSDDPLLRKQIEPVHPPIAPVLHEPSASSSNPPKSCPKKPRRSAGSRCAEFRDEVTINYSQIYPDPACLGYKISITLGKQIRKISFCKNRAISTQTIRTYP